MVAQVQLQVSSALRSVAAIAPAAAAADAATPSVAGVLDGSDNTRQFGLYQLDDGRVAIAETGLASGASLPAGAIVLMAGEKAWSPAKAGTIALASDGAGFQLILKSGDGAKAKFSRQNFDAAGLATGKASALSITSVLDAEVTAAQDLNNDNALGDVVVRALDSADRTNAIGLYVLTSGRLVIDDDAKANGSNAGAQSVTLTTQGKNWTPGKATALAVRATSDGYEVLLRSGTGAKAKYSFQTFDSKGVAVDKAQTATADVLLDRELLYGQDLNEDGQHGNVITRIVDPAAPKSKAAVATSPYARSATVNGEVFLGGRYIELGISKWGSFGTEGAKPAGFFGAGDSRIGMSADHDGYGEGNNLPVDYFLPGTPEERFNVAFQSGGTLSVASNSALMGVKKMPTTVTDTSSGRTLSATAVSTWSINGAAVMSVKQDISFDAEALWFKNTVTLTNLTANDWTGARYMRSFDPDNTAARGGAYITNNTVIGTAATDGFAAVKAETYRSDDPLYQAFGSRSPIMFFSMDARSVASTFGFSNENPYAAQAYNSPAARNATIQADQAITLAWDSGALKAGETASFAYYTSLDNRVADSIISDLYGVGLYQLKSGSYAVAKAPATTGELGDNRVILMDNGKPWSPKGAAPIAIKSDSEGYQITYKTGSGTKTKYLLQSFDPDGVAKGKPETLSTAKLVGLETDFQHDLNGDTYLGDKIATVVDAVDPAGHTGLYKVAAGGFWLSKNGLSAGSDLAQGAVQLVTQGKVWAPKKEVPVAVRVNASGLYELMLRTGSGATAKFSELTFDQTGALAGKGVAIKATQLAERETRYNQDLDGNGTIG